MANGEALTDEGRKKLEEELAWREGEHRTEIVERIKVARDFGDLSENSEFDDAKEEQAKNENRISMESPVGSALVGHEVGETVEVVLPSGKTRTYTITKIAR